jgi:hypothetical protein
MLLRTTTGFGSSSSQNSECEVQIESSTGMCPFLIETHESNTRFAARSIEEAVAMLAQLLHFPL